MVHLEVTLDPSTAEGDCGGEELSGGRATFRGQILIKGINPSLRAKTHRKPANQFKMNLTLVMNLHNSLQFRDKMNDLQEITQLRLNLTRNCNFKHHLLSFVF